MNPQSLSCLAISLLDAEERQRYFEKNARYSEDAPKMKYSIRFGNSVFGESPYECKANFDKKVNEYVIPIIPHRTSYENGWKCVLCNSENSKRNLNECCLKAVEKYKESAKKEIEKWRKSNG